jgi:transcription initiation factor TFIIIB Brf1 subunit/transcription initiation factor TFIIB
VITYFSELITSSVNIESVSIHVNVQRNVNNQLYNIVIKINNLQVNDVNNNAFVNVFADNLKIPQTLININIVQDEGSVIITIGISN